MTAQMQKVWTVSTFDESPSDTTYAQPEFTSRDEMLQFVSGLADTIDDVERIEIRIEYRLV